MSTITLSNSRVDNYSNITTNQKVIQKVLFGSYFDVIYHLTNWIVSLIHSIRDTLTLYLLHISIVQILLSIWIRYKTDRLFNSSIQQNKSKNCNIYVGQIKKIIPAGAAQLSTISGTTWVHTKKEINYIIIALFRMVVISIIRL